MSIFDIWDINSAAFYCFLLPSKPYHPILERYGALPVRQSSWQVFPFSLKVDNYQDAARIKAKEVRVRPGMGV